MATTQLETLAATDPLTGAFNRRYLFDLLETERQRILRGGEVMSVLLDLDHFKRINDVYGHAAGDIVLCEVVKRCVHILRATDAIRRYSGEEFVVFLPAVGSEGATQLAERLLAEAASSPATCGSDTINVTVSIGVANYTEKESIENLLSRGQAAL